MQGAARVDPCGYDPDCSLRQQAGPCRWGAGRASAGVGAGVGRVLSALLTGVAARRRPAARGARNAALTRLQGDKYRICSLCNDQTAFRMPEKRPLDCNVFAS